MLVLSRKKGQELVIGDNIRIVVNRISGNRVTIGIQAPGAVSVVRGELAPVVNAFREGERQDTNDQPLRPPVVSSAK